MCLNSENSLDMLTWQLHLTENQNHLNQLFTKHAACSHSPVQLWMHNTHMHLYTPLSHSPFQLGCFSKGCLCRGSWIMKLAAYLAFMKFGRAADYWYDYTKKRAGKLSDILIWKPLPSSLFFSIYLQNSFSSSDFILFCFILVWYVLVSYMALCSVCLNSNSHVSSKCFLQWHTNYVRIA